MMQSENIGAIAKALAEAQAELENPIKTKTAKAGTYSYKYADLADVLDKDRPVLAKHGIAVTQPTFVVDDILMIRTQLSHSSGEWMSSDYPVCRINGDHQKMGGAMTYARRYSYCSMIGVAADDDRDGEGAAEVDAPKRKSSAALKREGVWEKLEHELSECGSEVAVNRLQKSYETTEYKTWNQTYRDQADELFDKAREEFAKAPGEALTLREQLEGSVEAEKAGEPQTRAEYIQWAHETIAALESSEFIASWWKAEAAARKRFRLTPAEETDLHARAKERVVAIRAATFVPNARERAEAG